jgi:aminotransferase
MILSDEAYEKLTYDEAKHISIASLNGMQDNVITTQTFSKAYAMCGFRVGYAAGPEDIIKKMADMKVVTTLSASTISQFAALAALTGPQEYVEKMRKEYDRRRKMLVKRINEIPRMCCVKPQGAFYAFPNITGLRMNSSQTVDYFLKEAKILTIPGTEFGMYGEGFIRLSYATAYEKIEEAMDRIEESVKDLR